MVPARIVSFLIVATLKLVKENLSSERERSVRTDQRKSGRRDGNRREHDHADGYPNFTKNSDWRRKSEDISGKRRGRKGSNEKMKEMFHLLRSISFLFRCKAGFR